MAASFVEIGNRALQMLGATRIVSLTEDSENARSVNAAFEPVKLALLRNHIWNFAIKRAELAADATNPDFGRDRAYTLPADFVRLAPNYPEDNEIERDWQIEGKKILSDDTAPIQIRYIYDVTNATVMDPLFREAFSTMLARELAEEITNSNSKNDRLDRRFKNAIADAKRTNAIENVAAEPPEDSWLTVRRGTNRGNGRWGLGTS